jgi:hypothetical protein
VPKRREHEPVSPTAAARLLTDEGRACAMAVSQRERDGLAAHLVVGNQSAVARAPPPIWSIWRCVRSAHMSIISISCRQVLKPPRCESQFVMLCETVLYEL